MWRVKLLIILNTHLVFTRDRYNMLQFDLGHSSEFWLLILIFSRPHSLVASVWVLCARQIKWHLLDWGNGEGGECADRACRDANTAHPMPLALDHSPHEQCTPLSDWLGWHVYRPTLHSSTARSIICIKHYYIMSRFQLHRSDFKKRSKSTIALLSLKPILIYWEPVRAVPNPKVTESAAMQSMVNGWAILRGQATLHRHRSSIAVFLRS